LRILKSIEKLAADANPILSAIIGGKARTVFLSTDYISFYTTVFNFKAVEKYISILALNRNLPADDLYMALSTLPVHVRDIESYKDTLKIAKSMMKERDPDDVHLLGLVLKLACPIWSNDKDFEGLGIKVYTTLDLIRK
jgi:predicted nucleic acid-binding protein